MLFHFQNQSIIFVFVLDCICYYVYIYEYVSVDGFHVNRFTIFMVNFKQILQIVERMHDCDIYNRYYVSNGIEILMLLFGSNQS